MKVRWQVSRPVTEVRGNEGYSSSGAIAQRRCHPVGETGRVSLQPAAWASGPHYRCRVFSDALGRTQTPPPGKPPLDIVGPLAVPNKALSVLCGSRVNRADFRPYGYSEHWTSLMSETSPASGDSHCFLESRANSSYMYDEFTAPRAGHVGPFHLMGALCRQKSARGVSDRW